MATKKVLTVVKDDVVISIGNTIGVHYSDITDQTFKLNAVATAKNTGNTVSGTFLFTVNGVDLSKISKSFDVSSYDILASFIPTDTKNYNNSQITVSNGYVVSSTDVYITLTLTPSTIIYGTVCKSSMFAATAVDANGNTILGTFAYTINGAPFKEQILGTGLYDIDVIFTPSTPTNYTVKYDSDKNGNGNNK